MASNDDFSSHASYNDDELDVSDVVNLDGLNDDVGKSVEIKHSTSKRKHKFIDDDEMDFQTWTNGFLNDSITNSNDDEIVVDYYNNTNNNNTNNTNNNTDNNTDVNNQTKHNSNNTTNANNDNTSNNLDTDTNQNIQLQQGKQQQRQKQHHHHLTKKHKDDFILKCLAYERTSTTSNGNDEDLAVQAVNQAVNQAVQAVQDEVDANNQNDVNVNADIAAVVEDAVLNGLKVNEKDNHSKRSDRQLFELIQNAINNDKLVKVIEPIGKSKISKPSRVKTTRKQQEKVKSELQDKITIEQEASKIKNENENRNANENENGTENGTENKTEHNEVEKPVRNKELNEPVLNFADDSNEGKLYEAIVYANSQIPINLTESPSRSFTKEEKNAIDIFVKKYQIIESISSAEFLDRIWSNERKRDKFWDNLQKVLPYRTRPSLYKHVRRTYHVFKKRGVWSFEEDNQLRELQQKYDGKWKAIGEQMKRMPEDCRDRWRNYLKCGQDRNTNKWSVEEERILEDIVGSMEGVVNWTKVSELMNGKRSRIQCRYKWNKIVKRLNK